MNIGKSVLFSKSGIEKRKEREDGERLRLGEFALVVMAMPLRVDGGGVGRRRKALGTGSHSVRTGSYSVRRHPLCLADIIPEL
uniref:Uncharacterized protein n=1 Tax=Anguilla anguilla TaxID=7936 RepID=A0A0E9UFT7_ANGAN